MDLEASTTPAAAPPETPAAAAPASDQVKPAADVDRRAKEAARAKRRRLEAKLKDGAKDAKTEAALKKDAEEKAPEKEKEKLEPGQLPGWPAPSTVAQVLPLLEVSFKKSGGILAGVTSQDTAGDWMRGAGKVLQGDGGKQLAEAWAPVLAIYLPHFLTTPHGQAVVATSLVVAAVVQAAQAEAAARTTGVKA